jgi:predicted DNA binding CopG/RHH family protein
MTDPASSLPNSSKDSLVDKPVHTSDGFLIGRIHTIDNDSVVVKRDMVTTIYYHIPRHKVREWDGHALWLNINDKESKIHILPAAYNKNIIDDSITFDLDKSIINELHAEAEKHGISFNTYVSHIIKRFLEWDRLETKAGIIPISKLVVRELFNSRTKEDIVDIARHIGNKAVEDTAEFIEEIKNKSLDLNSFLSWLEADMDSYSIEVRHTTAKDNGNHHTYILKHDAGENYSLYYKTVLESIFDQVLHKHIDVLTSNDTTLAFEFEK